MKKLYSFLPALIFLVFLGVMALLLLFSPVRDYSENEKRYLAGRPEVTVSGILEGETQEQLEKFTADQVPGRDFFVGVNAYWNLATGRNGAQDIYHCKQGYLINAPKTYNEKIFTDNLTKFDQFAAQLGVPADLKDKKKKGIPVDTLRGKNVALIFEKTSTRTRCAFEVAAHDLGMGTTYLDPTGSQIGKKESIADTARVLAGMFEGIEYRGFGQDIVEELAKYSKVPVWNGLTNEFHPTQMLADLLTIREHFGHLKGIRMTYMGDARYNMGNSLMVACAKMGMHFTACTTAKYFPAKELVAECEAIAAQTGGSITLTEDVKAGTKDVDVIYTDVWVSMGEPDEVWTERIKELSPYQVNKAVMDNAGEQAIFMHCLPAFHDLKTKIGAQMGERFGITEMEVTDEVFESGQSLVFEEAENRMHTIKAVMAATL